MFSRHILTHAIYFAIESANRNTSRSLLSDALEKESPKEALSQCRRLSKQLLRHEKDASTAGVQGSLGTRGAHVTIFCLDGGIGERRFRNPLHSLPKSRLTLFKDRDKIDYFNPEARAWWTGLFLFCLERDATIKLLSQFCLQLLLSPLNRDLRPVSTLK